MDELNSNEKRFTRSSIKILTNLILVLVVIVILILFNFFILDDLTNGSPRDLVWWVGKILTGLGTFLVMIGLSNSTEESLKMKNGSFVQKIKSLDDHYTRVMEHGESEWINLYLVNTNKKSKYKKYIKIQKRKLAIRKKFVKHSKWESDEKIKRLELSLLITSEDVWAMEKRIRYPKLTFEKLVSGAYNVTEREAEENDVSVHRADAVFTKLLWKILIIVGLGMFLPDLMYHFNEFTKDDWIPLLFKIGSILWAIYSGVSFGFYMNDRTMVALKKKLKKFSEFRTRTDTDPFKNLPPEQRYSVKIRTDALIEKLKIKYDIKEEEPHKDGLDLKVEEHKEEEKKSDSNNPIVKTIQEIDHPISMGQLGTNLLTNIIREGAKNDT